MQPISFHKSRLLVMFLIVAKNRKVLLIHHPGPAGAPPEEVSGRVHHVVVLEWLTIHRCSLANVAYPKFKLQRPRSDDSVAGQGTENPHERSW